MSKYTTREAGRVLGLSPHTIRSAIRRGALQAERFGRDWMIDESAIRWYRMASLGRPGLASARAKKSKIVERA